MLRKYKRDILISIIPSLLISVLQIFGYRCVTNEGRINFHDVWLYISVVLLCIGCMIILVALGRLAPKFAAWLSKHEIKWTEKIDKHIFWVFFLVIIIIWIPTLLAVWPGVYSYDAVARTRDYYLYEVYTAHYPVLHNVFFIGSLELGNLIADSYNVGLLIYSIVQGVLMALCFAYSLAWMYRRNFSRWIVLIGLLFFAVNPIVSVLAFTTTHDILFGGVLLVALVKLLDAALFTEEFFASKRNIIVLTLILFLMCMLRNQGVYMLIVALPFAVLAWKRYRIKMLCSIGIPIVLFFLITGPFYSLIGIEKANAREALSVPMQQIGRVNIFVDKGITDEQYEEIYRYIPKKYLNYYRPEISDTIKSGFETDTFKEDPMGFIKVWFDVGIHNIGTYIDAFVNTNYGFYYIGNTDYYVEYIAYDGASMAINPITIQRETKFPLYDDFLRDFSLHATYEDVPVLRVILRQAFSFLLMIICIYYAWLRRSGKELVTLILPFGYWGTLLLGPVVGVRYAFPLMVMTPLFIGLLFYKFRTSKDEEQTK